MTTLTEEREAYNLLRQKAYSYVQKRTSARGARYVTARASCTLFLAGLPQTAVDCFLQSRPQPAEGGYYIITLKRPRASLYEFVVLPNEKSELESLAREVSGLYSTKASLIRSLQDELRIFKTANRLENVTYIDVYALKLRLHGLSHLLMKHYPARRLSLVLHYITGRSV